ncbi:MAG: phosphatidylserine/phosphatidylglycerophosphate/cardiolipin synthase family protein [bacterium]|nr:phosphatidylserine/phosphatidylglycerophosphate/cardiolipin synthase family protein [bacterium]
MKRETSHIPHVAHPERASYPLRHGNQVRPLVDGEPAFRAIGQAVERARRSVWVTVAFLEERFEMPDGLGSLFDLLDATAQRGIDVRVLFWRSPHEEARAPGVHFPGSEAQRTALADRGSRFLARWDVLPGELCHHQKSWLIDAGHEDEVAFVGGINLDPASVAVPGHPPRDEGNIHDVYLEILGPAASDVHHNFVQRWNDATERDREDGAWPDSDTCDDLHFPKEISAQCGEIPVQITRTVRHETYTTNCPTPGGHSFPIGVGESSVFEQYITAFDAARHSVYVEDQVIASPRIVECLEAALERGVEVVFLVPGNAHPEFVEARSNPKLEALFEPLHNLGRFEHFCLAGIASHAGPGRYHDIYVHAKVALVDDVWATIGSTNVADRSFKGDTELNASFWHAPTARALRIELLNEHLGVDTSSLDARGALRLFRDSARKNAAMRESGEAMAGLAFEIDPTRYGR